MLLGIQAFLEMIVRRIELAQRGEAALGDPFSRTVRCREQSRGIARVSILVEQTDNS